MEIIDWINSFIGFFSLLERRTKILILGLNKAGKSTLMRQMADTGPEGLEYTVRSTSEVIAIHNVRFVATNFGGYQDFHGVAGIILVVDAADYPRFRQVKAELDALLATREIYRVPIVVLGNKMDSLYAVSEEELSYQLGVDRIYWRPIELYMCSIASREGYSEAFRWLARHI